MSDLIKLTDLEVNYTLPTIKYDVTELKEEIEIIENKYKNFVVLEENIPSIKKDISKINKISKAIDTQRKENVKLIKAPITAYDNDIKELGKSLDNVYRSLKDQIDEFTAQEKENKRAEILALEEYVEEYVVFNEDWLKSATSIKSIKEDIERQRQIFENNILMIKTTCNALGLETNKYSKLLVEKRDITDIIEIIQNDKEVKDKYSTVESTPTPDVKVTTEEIADTDTYEFTLKLSGTRLQLKLLKEYLEKNEIKYEKV